MKTVEELTIIKTHFGISAVANEEPKILVKNNALTTVKNKIKKALAALFVLFCVSGYCQPCNVSISTSCHSVCVAGTFKIDTAFCGWFMMTATGAQTYTWNTNGVLSAQSPTVIYYPAGPGITNYTVTGSGFVAPGHPCHGTATISIEAIICAHSLNVGLREYDRDVPEPCYFDFQGNRIEKRFNELIIEQIGCLRRKIYFEN